jgi:hypothetical protein
MSHAQAPPVARPSQLGFTFEPPSRRRCPRASPGSTGSSPPASAARSRRTLALARRDRLAMSELLDEDVSRWMLDAYASEARDNHNISADRFLALIAVTNRFDILDATVRRIGAALLVGDEITTAELGNIDRQIAALKTRRKSIEHRAPVVRSRGAEWKRRGETMADGAELAELRLPGLPKVKRKINERAAAERWALRTDDRGAPLARRARAAAAVSNITSLCCPRRPRGWSW